MGELTGYYGPAIVVSNVALRLGQREESVDNHQPYVVVAASTFAAFEAFITERKEVLTRAARQRLKGHYFYEVSTD